MENKKLVKLPFKQICNILPVTHKNKDEFKIIFLVSNFLFVVQFFVKAKINYNLLYLFYNKLLKSLNIIMQNLEQNKYFFFVRGCQLYSS